MPPPSSPCATPTTTAPNTSKNFHRTSVYYFISNKLISKQVVTKRVITNKVITKRFITNKVITKQVVTKNVEWKSLISGISIKKVWLVGRKAVKKDAVSGIPNEIRSDC